MANFPFELVSPERLLISEEIEAVTLPGSEGEFQVLAGHAPFLALLGPGVMEVAGGETASRRLFIDGGFCDVNERGCTVLAEAATDVADLTAEEMEAVIARAEESAAQMEPAERDEAERRIASLRNIRLGV